MLSLPSGKQVLKHKPMTSLSIPALFHSSLIGIIAFLFTGCQTPWDVPTRYTIRDMEVESTRTKLRSQLSAFGFEHADGNPGEFAFYLRNVKNVSELKQVQVIIQEVSQKDKVPVKFKEANLLFGSVFGDIQAEILLNGRATVGSTVQLDVGGPSLVRAEVDAQGIWTARVQKTAKLAARGGWVYGTVEKEGARQWMKLNVLNSDSYTRIESADLPSDTPLPRR